MSNAVAVVCGGTTLDQLSRVVVHAAEPRNTVFEVGQAILLDFLSSPHAGGLET